MLRRAKHLIDYFFRRRRLEEDLSRAWEAPEEATELQA